MHSYPLEVKEFIYNNVEGRSCEELAKMINAKFDLEMTAPKIKSYKCNHGLKSGTPNGKPKGYSKVYPDEIQAFIKENVEGKSMKDLTNLINSTFNTSYSYQQLKSYMARKGLKNGRNTKFKSGHTPKNKGIKGICPPGCEKGWFKKGNMPQNYKPVGTERVNADGYVYVKIADPKTWVPKHHLVWKEHNGEIPKDKIIIFLDGNKQNTDISNLALIDLRENLELNRNDLRSESKELTKCGINVAKLKIAVKDRKKKTTP